MRIEEKIQLYLNESETLRRSGKRLLDPYGFQIMAAFGNNQALVKDNNGKTVGKVQRFYGKASGRGWRFKGTYNGEKFELYGATRADVVQSFVDKFLK